MRLKDIIPGVSVHSTYPRLPWEGFTGVWRWENLTSICPKTWKSKMIHYIKNNGGHIEGLSRKKWNRRVYRTTGNVMSISTSTYYQVRSLFRQSHFRTPTTNNHPTYSQSRTWNTLGRQTLESPEKVNESPRTDTQHKDIYYSNSFSSFHEGFTFYSWKSMYVYLR